MQKILGQVRRCVEDYHMIDAGDVVAVGVSGGKDSLVTLTALARLRAFYPIPFTVRAITLETGTPGMCFDAVADLCRQLDVPYTRIQVPVYDIVFNERKEKNPCSLCAKLRLGSLNTALTAGAAGGGEPLSRQRTQPPPGGEGAHRRAGGPVSGYQAEAVRQPPALPPVRLESSRGGAVT